jgi:hypothetical protein
MNLYRPGLALNMGIEGEFVSQVAELSARVEVSRVIRPRHRCDIGELADAVERDLA